MSREPDVLQMTNTLAFEHMHQALELLAISKRNHDPSWQPSDDADGVWPDPTAHRYALSSMMHAFGALEGHVNRVAYAVLREATFPYFVAPEKRTLEFRDLVSKWDSGLSIDKKVEFLLGSRGVQYPAYLIPSLRELMLLRNWIVHGKVYRTAMLIERSSDKPNSGTVHLRADDEEWAPKFPRFKFPMPDRLSYPDAREFLLAVADTLSHLADAYNFPPVVLVGPKGSVRAIILSAATDAISRLRAHFDDMP
jgi:hypothetical protein